MIAAVVRAHARTSEGADELIRLWSGEIEPLLRRQAGFISGRLLRRDLSLLHLAFWRSREDYGRFLESFDRASMLEAARLTDSPEIGPQEVYEVIGG